MKVKLILHCAGILFAAVAVLFLYQYLSSRKNKESSFREISLVKQSVERQLNVRLDLISRQIAGFATTAASDRDFSMKLLVENERSAPEVTETAQRYMSAMALPLLSITDSQHVLLSCGQFAASTGTVSAAAAALGEKPAFIMDNVKGETVLTVQAKTRFKILDAAFFACGGTTVGREFLSSLACGAGYAVFIKQGKAIIGMDNVESISDIRDNTMLLNNKEYPAAAITLPYIGEGDAPVLIIISNTPLK
jgi:hypothetical protein